MDFKIFLFYKNRFCIRSKSLHTTCRHVPCDSLPVSCVFEAKFLSKSEPSVFILSGVKIRCYI